MLFLGIVMMPFYYISKTHSVPGYLKLRFGEPSRVVSAVSFGFMTVLMSGINMYSMALVMQIVLGWGHQLFHLDLLAHGRGLRLPRWSAFRHLQRSFAVLPHLGRRAGHLHPGLIEAGGWSGMVHRIHERWPAQDYTHMWQGLGSFTANPMGINWVGIVMGLGFVISFRLLDHRFSSRPTCPGRAGSTQRQNRPPSSEPPSKWPFPSSSSSRAFWVSPFFRNISSANRKP